MSYKKNIIANYASQLYVTGIGILILPLYIKYMGAETYGLIGFFTMLQAWFGLLDMGLTPTIARETARYHGGSMSALHYRQLFRALSVIFIIIALVGGGGMFLLADIIAYKWLRFTELIMSEVVLAVQIMAISVALRWLGGLYRGVIIGSERLIWLSGFNAVIATLRFVCVFISMWIYGFTPVVFFLHQFVVALIEVIVLLLISNQLKPLLCQFADHIGWSFKPVKIVLKFSLMLAFTSSAWIFVTQSDKLILSGVLNLSEYGYFTLAVLVAGGIIILSTPINSVIMPRMARLHAEGKHDDMIRIYRKSTQIMSVIAGSATITIVFCAEALIFAWTGDKEITANVAPIMRLYALGNGVLVIAAFPYYLQYALGNLRYHLIGSVVMIVFLIPTVVISAIYYGGIGAGYAWFAVNAFYLAIWVGYIHHKLEPGLHWQWLYKDFLVIIIPMAILLTPVLFFNIDNTNRFIVLFYLLITGVLSIVIASILSSVVRGFLRNKIYGGKN